MRDDLASLTPLQLEDAPCGCERFEVDTATTRGEPLRGVTCLHGDKCALKAATPRRKRGE